MTDIEVRQIPFWLIVTSVRHYGSEIKNNWIVRAQTKDEAVQGIRQKFFAGQPSDLVKVDYVTNSLENPGLVRAAQIVCLGRDTALEPETFEWAELHLN